MNDSPGWIIREVDDPILDIASVGTTIMISFDSREEGRKRIRAVDLRAEMSIARNSGILLDDAMDVKLKGVNSITGMHQDDQGLDDLLYGVAKLRKRRGYSDGDDGY